MTCLLASVFHFIADRLIADRPRFSRVRCDEGTTSSRSPDLGGLLIGGVVLLAQAFFSSVACGQELPWRASEGVVKKSFSEVLAPLGFDAAYWESFSASETLDSDQQLNALRLLDRLSGFTPQQWEAWQASTTRGMMDDQRRGHVFRLRGVVTNVTGPYLLDREGLQGFRFDSFHVVTINTPNGDGKNSSEEQVTSDEIEMRVICREIPQAWLAASRLSEPCGMDGVLLAPPAGDKSGWLVADRLRWFANAENLLQVPRSWQFLGQHDVDLGRLETLQHRNQRALERPEREVLYPLLALLDKPPVDWTDVPRTPWSLTDILRAPADYQGQRLRGEVTARRVTRVLVGDPAITARLGIQSYYQIDVFFPLDGTKIRLAPAKSVANRGPSMEDAPVYSHGYPGTIVCHTLPAELQQASQRVLDGTAKTQLIQVPLKFDGIFVKIWSYRSPFLNRGEAEQAHPSPLFVAAELRVIDPPKIGKSSEFSLLIVGGFVVLFAGALLLAWWSGRSIRDRRPHRVHTTHHQGSSNNDAGPNTNSQAKSSGE